jgi:Spy/CpxP family protein refolding chaperone
MESMETNYYFHKKNGVASSRCRLFPLALAACVAIFWSISPLVFAETRNGIIGTTSVAWNLTPEQVKKVDPMLAQVKAKDQAVTQLIIDRRHQMDKLFMQPAPDRKSILALQSQIDKNVEELRLLQWKVALAIRKMLTQQQRRALGCLGPDKLIPGQKLTASQQDSYYRLMRPYLVTSLNTAKRLAALQRDRTELLQEMDMVHGCHAMKLDMPALMATQKEINKINSEMAMERLRVAISIHELLTPDQRNLFLRGYQVQIPDPIGVSLESNTGDKVPTAEKVFRNAILTKAQKAEYKSIMDKEVQIAAASKRMRDELIAHRLRMLSAPKLDVSALESIQDKINDVDSVGAMDRILTVAKVRNVLSPEQRHLVFNRHHPKIWNDTGINRKQDAQLMAIHMKIEESDRKGKREMDSLAADMTRLYYIPADNDAEILAAQSAFNKAQAQMEVAQLMCLFEGRDVLTQQQKEKLIQLMAINQKATH